MYQRRIIIHTFRSLNNYRKYNICNLVFLIGCDEYIHVFRKKIKTSVDNTVQKKNFLIPCPFFH